MVSAAVTIFYRLERVGPQVPAGPVILAANHPNSLLDPIVVFATAGRTPRPLAKAPLFERAVVGRMIRGVGGIPIYRREDDLSLTARNEDTFRDAIAALHSGDAIQIFPEGRSHSDPELSPLRTGAARIALAAEADADWSLGLALVPVGLTYVRKAYFRGRVAVLYGEPIAAAAFRGEFAADPRSAARALTEELDRRLRALTLNLTEAEDAALIDAAEKMWAWEKELRTPRERQDLAGRLPRLQAFARGLSWLRVHDPSRHLRLRRQAARYVRISALLGVGEGDVPHHYRAGATARWMLTVLVPVILLAPLALLAALAWWVPYRLVGAAVDRMPLAIDTIATYKVAASLIVYPIVLAVWVSLGAWLSGWPAAVAVLVALPMLGLVGVRWLDRFRDMMEDLRLFGRVASRGDRRDRLARTRRSLVAEFDAIQALVEESAAPAATAAGR